MKITETQLPSQRGTVTLVEMVNASGASVKLSNLGAGIVSIVVPDREGRLTPVTMEYADPANAYFNDGPCLGKTPGRVAGRIANGKFTIDGNEYQLVVNNGPNHLHGGPTGFQNQLWNTEIVGDDTVRFTLTSEAGHEGYPGTLNVAVSYTWSDDNTLTVKYEGMTDAATPVNLTNHIYFNLHGLEKGNGLKQVLTINASHWLPTDEFLTPSGEIAPVQDTPMDFRTPKLIEQDIKSDFDALRFGKGYDNCWVLDNPGMDNVAVRLESPISGIALEVSTDNPSAVVYTGNWLAGCPAGVNGEVYQDYDAVAIECQGLPDAVNHENFPSVVLRPGETYNRTIAFKFK